MIILPANTLSTGGYDVANSCRFNQGDSPYMHITRSGADGTAGQKCTISFWFKRVNSADTQYVFHVGGANYTHIYISSGGVLAMYDSGDNISWSTSAKLRDFSSWYHAVIKIDTTQGSNANRVKFYLNGTTEMAYASYGTVSEDAQLKFGQAVKHTVGRRDDNSSDYFDGYLAEFCFIDGLALAPTEFGEYDEDSPTIWKPKDVSGLTFGTNGFYLDFEDSSALGNDANGGTDLTVSGLAATDQCQDSPTNNWCVINANDNYFGQATLTEGNTKIVTDASAEAMNTGTFALTAGRWYFEVDFISGAGARVCGVTPTPSFQTSSHGKAGDVTPMTHTYVGGTGKIQTGNGSGGQTDLATLSSYSTGDIIGIYLDLEDMKTYWSKNGTLQNSGTGIDLTALASNGSGHYLPFIGDNNGGSLTAEVNFGNGYQSLSSAVADDNGYGNFEYSPNITGDGAAKSFYAICTKNLVEYG